MEESISLTFSTILTLFLFIGGLVSAILFFVHNRTHPDQNTPRTEIIKERSWSTQQVICLLSSLFLLYIAAGFTGRLFYEEEIPVARLIITLIIYTILITEIGIINRRNGNNWDRSLGMGFRNLHHLKMAPVIYLAAMPFLMIITKGWHLLLERITTSEVELQDVAKIISQELGWLEISYIVVAIFIAPILEELMFRGIILPYFTQRVGLKISTVFVSILFAVMHFHLPSFIPLLMLSALLCFAYWRTSSLWVCIGIHMIFNSVTILALNIAG